MTTTVTVDFWFDPACPYTWLTSRWVVEAATVRPLDVRWRVMSLAVLNEGRDDDPEGDPEGYLWMPVRICAAVLRHHGQEALGAFYAALWADPGDGGAQQWINDPEVALADAGLPPGLAEAATCRDYDDAVRASHAEGIAALGPHVGTPVVAVPDPRGDADARIAFFGPVMSRVPRGEEAGRLWDATLVVTGAPGFHELKGAPADPSPDVRG
ncbi:disulfide bond formation protein DsbA [Streptomyces botrytidirepellens]|uniref:Disulfide bond formation protein DsbA n=1 Tax=Streptomyces botrytidirepellens TaxID=2486417 RepID=A0A3M8UFY8_9ACTN|nr:disulfide bond formation protein DsbA [Streptomyces botrytidirepellens]RNG04372.1 disulfide bond formation protein DsbA [Streptomyces botrytidirepellens]